MTQEKLVARARLIASGIIRYYKLETAKEVAQSLGILAEELAQIVANDEVRTIRGIVERYGLQVADVQSPVQEKQLQDHQMIPQHSVPEGSILCTGCTKVLLSDMPVHGGFAVDSQGQQKSRNTQFRTVGRTCTNMYIRDIGPGASKLPKYSGNLQGNISGTTEESSEIDTSIKRRRSTGSWTWRQWSYNRVPPAIEDAVREKFNQGWSKSKLAREFRLNRRTIIRICKENKAQVNL